MNGPEHYAEAERLLAMLERARDSAAGALVHPTEAMQLQTSYQVTADIAQAHATLAQTAATVNGRASAALDHHDEWAEVLGTTEEP